MDYGQWNRAITDYFTAGLSSGDQVYLSVDEDVLEEIGAGSTEIPEGEGWTPDFLNAVRTDCVSGEEVSLAAHHFAISDGAPGCVAFLAAMVLAATYMAEEVSAQTVAAEHNYFTRLREVLGLSLEERGRPRGFPARTQETLWWLWKRFLVERTFVPTAERGSSVASRYIQYPISQALLRHGDMARLDQIFRQERQSHHLPDYCDLTTMSRWFRRYLFSSHHLRELARETDLRRSHAAVEALLELYNTTGIGQPTTRQVADGQRVVVRRLLAGWYRVEDLLTGEVKYLLYPRQPRRGLTQDLEIESRSGWLKLSEERPGRFSPLWEEPLTGGTHYRLRGDKRWSDVVVPEARFRIFVPDPDDPSSNVLADWRPPGIEETFLFACKAEYIDELGILREKKIIEWADEPIPLHNGNEGWFELRECMVLARQWDAATPAGEDLVEALRPKVSATISFTGGLRAPVRYRWVWLRDYAGIISVAAFEEYVRLRVTNVTYPDEPVFDEVVRSGSLVALSEVVILSIGHYLTEALINGRSVDQKTFEIVDWEDLRPKKTDMPLLVTRLGNITICGALIERKKSSKKANEESVSESNGKAIQQDSEASAKKVLSSS